MCSAQNQAEVASKSMGSSLASSLIQRAKDMGPVLASRSKQCQTDCRVPDETIADFHAAGFFKILQSQRWGGYEMDPQVYYTVIMEVAKYCTSSAWVLSVIGVHNWQMNLFSDQASEEVWGSTSSVLISSSYAPVGKVTPVEGGYRLSGHWSFSSGCEHCNWVFLGAVVPTEGEPFNMMNYRTFLLPISDYAIKKNWDVAGLQGTGSHDIIVDDVFVPEHRTHNMLEDMVSDKLQSKPALYRVPFMQVFSRAVCTASLGATHAILDDFIAVAKTRVAGPTPMKDDPKARAIAAQARAEIDRMKCAMYADFDRMMEAARNNEYLELDDRARFRYESSTVADRCLALSSTMIKAGGSGGIRLDSDMLARHMDVFASQAHVANVSEPFAVNLGALLFGLDPTDPTI